MVTNTKVYSIQPRFTRGLVAPATGWAWVDYLFRSYSKSKLPAYGTWQRDVFLAEVWKQEPVLAGVFNAFIERVQTRQWKVSGARNKAMRSVRLLNGAEGGQGFGFFLGLQAADFLITDKGAMAEKGRQRKGATTGPVMGLQHLDATRMVMNYDLKDKRRQPGRWVYLPQEGEPVAVPNANLLHIIPAPSGRDRFQGLGYCTMSRLYDAMEMMIGFLTYYRQKIGNLPPQLIAILNGMSKEQLDSAYRNYQMERANKDSDVYPGVFFLGSDDPANPVTLTTTQFAGLPDGFDWNTFADWWVKLVALNIGESAGDYWLLQHMGLGGGQGYVVQQEMARGRGSGRFVFEMETKINVEVLPIGVEFSFDAPDDEEDARKADILSTNIVSMLNMAKAGAERGEFLYTIDEIRDKSVELGVLPSAATGREVPTSLGVMLKRYAGLDEPQVYVTSDYRTIEIAPHITGKTADIARELYMLLEGYYAPRVGEEQKIDNNLEEPTDS